MLLEREQINRYLRHILLPEISGSGQKNLLGSSVSIYGENVNTVTSVIYYLTAAGVGRIGCQLDDFTGSGTLSETLTDLNSDVIFEFKKDTRANFTLFLGSPGFITNKRAVIMQNCAPIGISLYNGFKGGLKFLPNHENLQFFLDMLSHSSRLTSRATLDKDEVLSNSVLGALSAMEVIKFLLGIGERIEDFLYFNLASMEFIRVENLKIEQCLAELCMIKSDECLVGNLAESKVLIVGAGGLGSPAAYALALAGVGTIGLVDYDIVEISNLNRQILHGVSRLGMPKVESAAAFLKNISPNLKINCYNTSLSRENVFEIIGEYDVVIDAVDNFPTRFLLNDACFFADKPLIEAGVIRFDGNFMTILPKQGPCYRCTLANIPSPESTPSCSESGVLGPVPGIMGFIQAAEAVKLLAHQRDIFRDHLLFFDGMFSNFFTIRLNRNSACPLCGTKPTIHELQEYVFKCSDNNK